MQFPPIRGWFPTEAIKQLSQLVNQPALANALKETAQRLGWKEGSPLAQFQDVVKQAGRWAESMVEPWMQHQDGRHKAGINATGEIFNARWTTNRVPSETLALSALLRSTYSECGDVQAKLTQQFMSLTGAQEVVVAPNLSIAVWLVAATANQDSSIREIVLPRVHCIRVPCSSVAGGVPLRTILDEAHARTIEIGSAQDCSADDFQTALHDASQMLLVASPSPAMDAALTGIKVASNNRSSICILALDGSLHDLTPLDIHSTVLSKQWELGADLIVIPGSHLLGGPECGVILGKLDRMKPIRHLIDRLGWEADLVTRAMLCESIAATDNLETWSSSPVGAFFSTSIENLEHRAKRMQQQLEGSPSLTKIELSRRAVRIGAGSWQTTYKESATIRLFPKEGSSSALAERLSRSKPAIWCNVHSDSIELVMRSIEPDEDRMVVDAFLEPAQPRPSNDVEVVV